MGSLHIPRVASRYPGVGGGPWNERPGHLGSNVSHVPYLLFSYRNTAGCSSCRPISTPEIPWGVRGLQKVSVGQLNVRKFTRCGQNSGVTHRVRAGPCRFLGEPLPLPEGSRSEFRVFPLVSSVGARGFSRVLVEIPSSTRGTGGESRGYHRFPWGPSPVPGGSSGEPFISRDIPRVSVLSPSLTEYSRGFPWGSPSLLGGSDE